VAQSITESEISDLCFSSQNTVSSTRIGKDITLDNLTIFVTRVTREEESGVNTLENGNSLNSMEVIAGAIDSQSETVTSIDDSSEEKKIHVLTAETV
jgi:hypothetical protein